jgi:gamma-tubulin complex component 2
MFFRDDQARELFQFLLQRASIPYFEILEKWVYEGKICDPYHEFMVEEDTKLKKESLVEEFNDT